MHQIESVSPESGHEKLRMSIGILAGLGRPNPCSRVWICAILVGHSWSKLWKTVGTYYKAQGKHCLVGPGYEGDPIEAERKTNCGWIHLLSTPNKDWIPSPMESVISFYVFEI